MRTLHNDVKEILASDNVSTFYLVDLKISDVFSFRDTSASHPLTFEGNTYNADGNLLGVEPPRLSDTMDRESYKITYIDPEFDKLEEMEGAWTGKLVTVYAGFYNTLNRTVGGVAPGQPILANTHVIIAYKGRVDKPVYTIDPDSGSVVVQLECVSPAAALGLVKGFYTSDQSMRARYPNDSSFKDVHVGGEEAAIVWGKK